MVDLAPHYTVHQAISIFEASCRVCLEVNRVQAVLSPDQTRQSPAATVDGPVGLESALSSTSVPALGKDRIDLTSINLLLK